MAPRRGAVRLLVAAGALTGLAAMAACSVMAPPFGAHRSSLPTTERIVALTYDDGPNPPHTEAILEILAREQVPATWFVMGAHVEAHPDSARAILAGGHELANHTWSHPFLPALSIQQVRQEFERTDAILEEIGATGPYRVRAPWTARGLQAAWWLAETGREHVGVSASGWDWEPSTGREVADRVLRDVAPGTIVLLHDGGHDRPDADRSWTVEATALLIPALRAQGYRFVRIGDLPAPE